MLTLLRRSFERFTRNPLAESLLTALFLLAACTGILLGPAALLYLWHHNPQAPETPLRAMLLTQRLQNTRRLPTAFWCGLILWVVALIGLTDPELGLPLWMILVQPLWVMILLADRFDLPLPLTAKAAFNFFRDAPQKAWALVLLGLFGFAGALCFGIGIFITLPVAVRAMLLLLEESPRELAAAVQKAY